MLKAINTLAAFVAKNGPQFEELARQVGAHASACVCTVRFKSLAELMIKLIKGVSRCCVPRNKPCHKPIAGAKGFNRRFEKHLKSAPRWM
jgi:hypothetical protein